MLRTKACAQERKEARHRSPGTAAVMSFHRRRPTMPESGRGKCRRYVRGESIEIFLNVLLLEIS